MRAVLPAVLGTLAALAAGPPLGADPVGRTLRSEHYDLYVEEIDLEAVAALLEDLHAQLRDFFGAQPEVRLPLEVFGDRARAAEALSHAGWPAVAGIHGLYLPPTRTAYTWLGSSRYHTFHAILHEATHQFHFLAVTSNVRPSARWYAEGLADYFATHEWDGDRLRTGAVPLISWEDRPAQALAQFEASGHDLAGLVSDERDVRTPEAWGFVHFLMTRHREGFRKLAARLDRGEVPLAAWIEVFGPPNEAWAEAFHAHLEEHQQPWRVMEGRNWYGRAATLEAWSSGRALAILKRMPGEFTAVVERRGARGTAGLVFTYLSPRAFRLLELLPGGNLRKGIRVQPADPIRGTGGRFLYHLPPPASPGSHRLAVRTVGEETEVTANGRVLGRFSLTGQVGVFVEGCQALFHIEPEASAREAEPPLNAN